MDVVVVGAGIVGLSAARFIAERGIDVDVYDSKKSVEEGAPKASGIISVRGLKSTGIEYSEAVVNPLSGARLHAAGSTLTVKSSKVEAYVVDRGLLVKSAERMARKVGVKIHLGERLGRERISEIQDSGNTILIGADGAVSNVASVLGFPKISERVLTYKAEAETTEAIDDDLVDIFFSKKVSNGLFGWIVPYSANHIEIGIGVGEKQRMTSRKAFDMLIDSGAIKGIDRSRIHDGYASMIPLKQRSRTVIGNTALVGDAAGQVKATTGGGIVFGVGCARILAEYVSRAARNEGRLAEYETAWRKIYGADLKMHSIIHRYYSSVGDPYLGATFSMMRHLGFERFFSRHGDMDRPMRMLRSFLTFGLID
ncbi:MAG: NAD(P)/FAD-dependent oxidoreductase [Candidatus Marsarchaeota archaeon]|jgi:flavin-dependent dehydrogenase|nr:NAD(P)/FAD-dependent oxidoreductase [Candidatus Marsarchaeota archaeon]MCL5112426.1 NAD(P)/FAD-dependent oxidoreductase [Candidatus Marsarchaeota archaeon]